MCTLPRAGHARHHRRWLFSPKLPILISIVLFVIPVLISLTVPIFTRSRMYGRETAAIQAIRTIHTAEIQYQSQFGRYAASLTELGPPASGAPNALAAGLIGNDLANSEKAGYKFTVDRKRTRLNYSHL